MTDIIQIVSTITEKNLSCSDITAKLKLPLILCSYWGVFVGVVQLASLKFDEINGYKLCCSVTLQASAIMCHLRNTGREDLCT